MNSFRRISSLLFFASLIGALPIRAENPYSVETKPPRGFMPTADQLTSPIDSIDPVSGKFFIADRARVLRWSSRAAGAPLIVTRPSAIIRRNVVRLAVGNSLSR